MEANATFALNAGEWFRRVRLLMISPDSSDTACPLSGRNSTYHPVQISEASSLDVPIAPALRCRCDVTHRPHFGRPGHEPIRFVESVLGNPCAQKCAFIGFLREQGARPDAAALRVAPIS